MKTDIEIGQYLKFNNLILALLMAEIKKSAEAKDYKERFEFRLTVGDNIICQRYFKINNFNTTSLRSYELADTIRKCAEKIDRDLIFKTQAYLEIVAPKIFHSKHEMNEYFSKAENCEKMHLGEGIVVVGSDKDYFWAGNHVEVSDKKFDDGEFSTELTSDDMVEYKLAFYVDEVEACSTVWTGVYPKYIRNSIDLSNRRGRLEDSDKTSMSFEQYVMYKIVEGRKDLVWAIIRDICNVCSMRNEEGDDYLVSCKWGNKTYKNYLSAKFRNWV